MSRSLGIFTKGKRTRVSSHFLLCHTDRVLCFAIGFIKNRVLKIMSSVVFASSDEFTPVEDEKNNSESSSEGKVGTV